MLKTCSHGWCVLDQTDDPKNDSWPMAEKYISISTANRVDSKEFTSGSVMKIHVCTAVARVFLAHHVTELPFSRSALKLWQDTKTIWRLRDQTWPSAYTIKTLQIVCVKNEIEARRWQRCSVTSDFDKKIRLIKDLRLVFVPISSPHIYFLLQQNYGTISNNI